MHVASLPSQMLCYICIIYPYYVMADNVLYTQINHYTLFHTDRFENLAKNYLFLFILTIYVPQMSEEIVGFLATHRWQ